MRAASAKFLALFLTAAAFTIRLSAAEPEFHDVFVPKSDGFASIRIPSLVVAPNGSLLAFAEGRAANTDQAHNKIILKRSGDLGRTWSAVDKIADDGRRSLNNPCAVVERESGTVLLMYQSYPDAGGERSEKIKPGYDGEFVVRCYLLTSADNGATWSKPRDVTREIKRPEKVTTLCTGPGVGIQQRHGPHAGRLLIPINEGPYGLWNIYATYSDDKGQTWQRGEIAPGGIVENGKGKRISSVNESQLVELQDGAVRFNVRQMAGQRVRKTSVSRDGGVTWSPVEDSPDLRDPGCMASVVRFSDPGPNEKSRILYSGPQSAGRDHGTISVSYDEGATWPVHRVLAPGGFAYSVLAVLPDRTFGCLYEADGYERIAFARFPLNWVEQ
jgi:sialidase-1